MFECVPIRLNAMHTRILRRANISCHTYRSHVRTYSVIKCISESAKDKLKSVLNQISTSQKKDNKRIRCEWNFSKENGNCVFYIVNVLSVIWEFNCVKKNFFFSLICFILYTIWCICAVNQSYGFVYIQCSKNSNLFNKYLISLT